MNAEATQGGEIFQIVFLLAWSVPLAITSYKLAKDKGRNVALWTILGVIPVLNLWCLPFFIGAANLRLEARIEELLKHR